MPRHNYCNCNSCRATDKFAGTWEGLANIFKIEPSGVSTKKSLYEKVKIELISDAYYKITINVQDITPYEIIIYGIKDKNTKSIISNTHNFGSYSNQLSTFYIKNNILYEHFNISADASIPTSADRVGNLTLHKCC